MHISLSNNVETISINTDKIIINTVANVSFCAEGDNSADCKYTPMPNITIGNKDIIGPKIFNLRHCCGKLH